MVSSIDKIKLMEEKYRKELPDFNVGDTVKMKVRVAEADKTRLHPFEGIVIRKNSRGLKSTFTVRKVSFGEGVERVFPMNSPVIDSLKVVQRGVVNRSKLYYLRDRVGKGARVKKEISAEHSAPVAAPAAPTVPAQ